MSRPTRTGGGSAAIQGSADSHPPLRRLRSGNVAGTSPSFTKEVTSWRRGGLVSWPLTEGSTGLLAPSPQRVTSWVGHRVSSTHAGSATSVNRPGIPGPVSSHATIVARTDMSSGQKPRPGCPRKGFAYITITARRVGPPTSAPAQTSRGAAGDPPHMMFVRGEGLGKAPTQPIGHIHLTGPAPLTSHSHSTGHGHLSSRVHQTHAYLTSHSHLAGHKCITGPPSLTGHAHLSGPTEYFHPTHTSGPVHTTGHTPGHSSTGPSSRQGQSFHQGDLGSIGSSAPCSRMRAGGGPAWETNIRQPGARADHSVSTFPSAPPRLFTSCLFLRVSWPGPRSVSPSAGPPPTLATAKQSPGPRPRTQWSATALFPEEDAHSIDPGGIGSQSQVRLVRDSTGGDGSGPQTIWDGRWERPRDGPPSQHEGVLDSDKLQRTQSLGTRAGPYQSASRVSVVPARTGKEDEASNGWKHVSAVAFTDWSCLAGDSKRRDFTAMRKRSEKSNRSEMLLKPLTFSAAAIWSPDASHWPVVDSESEKTPPSPLTLREALQVHRPQFISRSRERLEKLQHMVQQRKAQCRGRSAETQPATPAPTPTPKLSRKKQFTVPHPLSDNLFKPKERFISEKEMHMRSKRIYDNLPEVRKKKEEQMKRVILQTNQLRAKVFKKQLLDQLLHRNTD
ncbi:(E2-independent) E3 ubiquitin-conjugating enzyme FATS isoform X1 [Ornithorhynchus anatinus]|uniref:ALMS motif domain-containing protein n=1 Tax=Ornithorhynchus anatinus TaxID=9258 RepID=A0A6I8MZ49_ORNAN|nr:(E2-independent) E3 ubiquitin-conjugating enzyme FATS isoform X1 [Ornithorhynchus anatinus]